MNDLSGDFSLSCPLPHSGHTHILLGHGSGGELSRELIENIFLPAWGNQRPAESHDGAVLAVPRNRLAFTTDSYVVHPLIFPGGDIGSMAVYGTVNDLAMCGAKPLYLSVSFILEEGLSMETLRIIVASMKRAADVTGVRIVTGDTKVVDRGKGDGVFINTAGIGEVVSSDAIGPSSIVPGDRIIVSGDLGRHGMTIMAQREGLQFETALKSDSGPLWECVRVLLEAGIKVHCLRDLTRGGLATALVEMARGSDTGMRIREDSLLIEGQVQAACEILGLDPLYVANEGRFAAVVAAEDADRALDLLRQQESSREAAAIGFVTADDKGYVILENRVGTTRILEMLQGDQLPRIC